MSRSGLVMFRRTASRSGSSAKVVVFPLVISGWPESAKAGSRELALRMCRRSGRMVPLIGPLKAMATCPPWLPAWSTGPSLSDGPLPSHPETLRDLRWSSDWAPTSPSGGLGGMPLFWSDCPPGW